MGRVIRNVAGAIAIASLTASCSEPVEPVDAAYHILVFNCHGNESGFATGIAITPDLVATAGHPLTEHTRFEVVTSSGADVEAELVYLDLAKDVAILRLANETESYLPLADPEDDTSGEMVLFDRDRAMVEPVNIVAILPITMDGAGERDGLVIRAEIDPGDSGAGVLVDNKVVGIVFAKATQSIDKAWAVSSSEFSEVVDNQDLGTPLAPNC